MSRAAAGAQGVSRRSASAELAVQRLAARSPVEKHHQMRILGLGVGAVRGTVVLLSLAAAAAAQIPVDLPDPDGRAGDPTEPVQVYILAGQSNMVGMGDLSGAQNVYTGVYLSSDPAVPEGPLPIYRVGNFKVGRILTNRENGEDTDAPH